MASFDGSYKYPAIYVCTFSFVFQNAFVTYFIFTDILSKPFGVMLLLMLNSYFNTNCLPPQSCFGSLSAWSVFSCSLVRVAESQPFLRTMLPHSCLCDICLEFRKKYIILISSHWSYCEQLICSYFNVHNVYESLLMYTRH